MFTTPQLEQKNLESTYRTRYVPGTVQSALLVTLILVPVEYMICFEERWKSIVHDTKLQKTENKKDSNAFSPLWMKEFVHLWC